MCCGEVDDDGTLSTTGAALVAVGCVVVAVVVVGAWYMGYCSMGGSSRDSGEDPGRGRGLGNKVAAQPERWAGTGPGPASVTPHGQQSGGQRPQGTHNRGYSTSDSDDGAGPGFGVHDDGGMARF